MCVCVHVCVCVCVHARVCARHCVWLGRGEGGGMQCVCMCVCVCTRAHSLCHEMFVTYSDCAKKKQTQCVQIPIRGV